MRKFLSYLGALAILMSMSLPAQAVKVYFTNPGNWSTVKAYFYSGSGEYKAWDKADAMTKATGNIAYEIDVPSGFENGNVIFHNGAGEQYPANGATTTLAIGNKNMICAGDNHLWVEMPAAEYKVYFDNSTENWASPSIHYYGLKQTTWPGVAMTLKEGKIYEATIPASFGAPIVIFTNGASNDTQQSADIVAVPNHVYKKDGTHHVYQATVSPFYIYFDNSNAKWATPYVHYWGAGGANESTFPGVAMALDEGKIYKYQVPGGTTGVIFSAGGENAASNQTADFDAVADHIYTQDGDAGLRAGYTPNVDVPSALYVVGTLDKTWDPANAVQMTKEGNTYKIEHLALNPSSAADQNAYFSFITVKNADWNTVNASARYGAATENAPVTVGTPIDVVKYTGSNAGNAYAFTLPADEYTLVIDFETMQLTATKTGTTGEGALIIPNFSSMPGRDATMAINLNSDPMRGVQFHIALPADAVKTVGVPFRSPTLSNHILNSSVESNGDIFVTVYSENNTTFSATDGALMFLPMTIDPEAELGDYTVTIKDIIFSDANGKKVTAANITGTLTIGAIGVTELSLNQESIALKANETFQLIATVKPDDAPAAAKVVTWSSDNTAVATVSDSGLVTAKANGTATITATCSGLTATATVTVGKTAQTITWEPDFASLKIGDEKTLSATASSGLDVEFVITVGNNVYAKIENGKLIGLAEGSVTVQARQAGNDAYAPANPVTKTFTVTLNYVKGDVNGDDMVTVADAATVISYLHHGEPNPFNASAADVDIDGEITINDVTNIVQLALAYTAANPTGAPALYSGENNYESFEITGKDYTYRISFSNMQNYVATQFDLVVPEDVELNNAVMFGSNHKISHQKISDNVIRMIVLSEHNDNFATDGAIHVFFNKNINDSFDLTNALVDRLEGDNIVETRANGTSSSTTGIAAIEAGSQMVTVYSVDGICVFRGNLDNFKAEANSGVYMIRKGNKVEKVVLK